MNVVLTVDYEIFFGRRTGTVEHTLLAPTEALCNVAGRYSVPLVFFVDVGYLLRLREEANKWPALMRDYDGIVRQLAHLVKSGHEVQLHIHSHWEDSKWSVNGWSINRQRYRLHDFSPSEVGEIVSRYSNALRDISGGERVFAYRAGGWAIQPFSYIRTALLDAGIVIDSTVFPGGVRRNGVYGYDFRKAPNDDHWFFDDDPLLKVENGPFLEIPISSQKVSPSFYWRYALLKKLGGPLHHPFGDGMAIPSSKSDLFRMLAVNTVSVVSIDGYKANLLASAFEEYKHLGRRDFVTIGHPKSLTPYSLSQVERFLSINRANNFVGYKNYLERFSVGQ